MQPGFEDAANDGEVEFAGADQQPGEQVQSRVPAEVTHGRGVALADLDQTRVAEPLERLADGGAGHAEHLGEPPLAGQRLAGLHVAAEHLGDDLLEDVFGDRSTVDRLQGHGPSMAGDRSEVKWSDQ